VWELYVPQADLRYVGAVPVARFATQAEAQATADALLVSNSYYLDAAGWWRPVV
jgi:Fe-S cluster assembly scaffold protein SufB